MSVFKQAEEAKLTLEEIQELLTLLEEVLPKIESRVKQEKNLGIIQRNLRDEFTSKDTGIKVPIMGSDEKSLDRGYKLLMSVNNKLGKFKDLIEEENG